MPARYMAKKEAALVRMFEALDQKLKDESASSSNGWERRYRRKGLRVARFLLRGGLGREPLTAAAIAQ
jgi:hypothetical protein